MVNQYLCTFFCQKLTTALLESAEGREQLKKIFHNLFKRMLHYLVGVKPATSWTPVRSASDWATQADLKESKISQTSTIVICQNLLCTKITGHHQSHLLWQWNEVGNLEFPSHSSGRSLQATTNGHNSRKWTIAPGLLFFFVNQLLW